MDEMIAHATNPRYCDVEFLRIFFVKYRKFLSPSELLARLISMLENE